MIKNIRIPEEQLSEEWQDILSEELQKPYMCKLATFLKNERSLGNEIYPPANLVFSAFNYTPFSEVKVVIIGQDPYHGEGQAHGLSFSVPEGVRPPPSLVNIFKELVDDIGITFPSSGSLIPWARQGVLLINAVLTVYKGAAGSHHGIGWESFTDAVVSKLNQRKDPIVFVLWGRNAQMKAKHLNERHKILKASHPSPLSAYNGFFGCRHFSQINEWLIEQGKNPINWQI